MSDFSYQKITTTASDCSLYWDFGEEPQGGWAMAVACSVPLCRNTEAWRTMWHPPNACPAEIKTHWKHYKCWMLCEGGGFEWEMCPAENVQTRPLYLPSSCCTGTIAQLTSPSRGGQSSCTLCCPSLSHWAQLLRTPAVVLLESGKCSPKAQVLGHSVNNPITAVFIYCLPSLNSIRLFCPGRKHWTVLMPRKPTLDYRTQPHILWHACFTG